jgi:MYXO-CTERM domain-containing protein
MPLLLPLVFAFASGGDVDPDEGLARSTPAIPTADLAGGGAARAPGTPEFLFVNFDGGLLQSGCGNDPHYDCSTLAETFDGYVGPFEGNLAQRVGILQATRKDLAEFGVQVTIERPPEDVDYTMVMYGDLGSQSFAGIAPYIDCEDRRGGDTSFTQGFVTSNTGSTVILQEAAHTWGLEHVDSGVDILNPFKSGGLNQRFVDDCFRIVANTDLEPTAGSCNQVHTQYCETGYQNSWREMMQLFGPHIPDTEAPTLDILRPIDGSVHVLPTTFFLQGDIDDNMHPQVYRIDVFVNGAEEPAIEATDATLNLRLENPPPDDYELLVRVTDEEGNVVEEVVTFTVLPEGSELPVLEDDPALETPSDEGCSTSGRRPARGALWALGGLVLLTWRRRRC